MPLDPKQIVDDAKKVGLIGFAQPVTLPPKLPPAGPKVDRRCGPRHKTHRQKRYVLTLAQLKAERPHLYL